MKKIIFLVCLVAIVATAHAQQAYQPLTADTVKGAQTKYITATAKCDYYGYATFDFSIKGFGTGDSAYIQLQGKNQGTTWDDVGTKVSYGGNSALSKQIVTNPVTYLNYRLKITGKASDTVRVYQPLFIYKR